MEGEKTMIEMDEREVSYEDNERNMDARGREEKKITC